jgi:hypothetical protein
MMQNQTVLLMRETLTGGVSEFPHTNGDMSPLLNERRMSGVHRRRE